MRLRVALRISLASLSRPERACSISDGEARQAVRRIEGAAGGVLNPERVQRHAIRQRMDARIHDRGAGDGERAGDAAEQPGMVGGVDQ